MKTQATPRPRGRPRSFEKDAALDRMIPVFRERGYEGTSLEDLTAASGLAKPSLYAAFGDKRALFLAALDRYRATQGSMPVRRMAEAAGPAEGIRAFLAATIDLVTAEGGAPGCLAAGAAGMAAACEAPVRAWLDATQEATEQAIADRLAAWQASGQALPLGDAGALARLLLLLMHGLASRARAGASRPELEAAVGSALVMLGIGSAGPEAASRGVIAA